MNITPEQVLAVENIWDGYIYVIFFFGLLALFLLGSKSPPVDTGLIGLVILVAAMDKASAWGYVLLVEDQTPPAFVDSQYAITSSMTDEQERETRLEFHKKFMGTFGMRVLLVIAPLAIVGRTRVKRIRAITGLMVLINLPYVAGRWLLQQSNAGVEVEGLSWLPHSDPWWVVQGSLVVIVLGEILRRWNSNRRRSIDGNDPIHVFGIASMQDVIVEVPQRLDHGA